MVFVERGNKCKKSGKAVLLKIYKNLRGICITFQ
jgi:hypothetical protein